MCWIWILSWAGWVALLAEGVDRNALSAAVCAAVILSPSSRRAWIEMVQPNKKERMVVQSPSSRRAWIEIRL